MPIIEVSNLYKQYGDKTVFKDFSFNVDRGEMVAITGESGCGKSTLLNIIGLLETFDTGRVTIDGHTNIMPNSPAAEKLLRKSISYLFQNFALVDDETVQYNLMLALKYVKLTNAEKNSCIQEALQTVGLNGYKNKKIFQLSGGEQQRVAIARIMLKPGNIVLADEPTGSVDPHNREIIINMLKELNKNGKTILIVTHDPYVAEQCDRIITISEGLIEC